MKKLEQYVENHKQYRDSYDKCQTWIRDMSAKLSTCQDTSGDKETIQSQLEKLHVRINTLNIIVKISLSRIVYVNKAINRH